MNEYASMLAAYGVTEARPGGKKMTEMVLKKFPIPSYSTVLEVGCGLGDTAKRLTAFDGVTVKAVDNHPKMIKKAKERHGENPKITWITADIQSLELEKDTVDTIILESVLSFTPLETVLPKLFSWLKTEGFMCSLDPLYLGGLPEKQLTAYKDFYGFRKLLTAEEWKKIFHRFGFTVKHVIGSKEILEDSDELTVFPEIYPDENIDHRFITTLEKHLQLSEEYFPYFDFAYFICEKQARKPEQG
ncbi:Methyltransferase domain-containing protein [Evansella caseinilytica]|uniref:Methyltransferase domain-containing protein n=1 Tax=Evansella caseinilytica TaxID=1503961 RepID=A0A1H3PRD3_9BACI|nr:class I SAM-dependent methyltransferase [Evansella caseinilytica]SDZ02969.1 Methyltransferase domain-containing protein [Evansella caseinilytica]